MGLSPFKPSLGNSTAPNPDPKNFKILKTFELGGFTVAEVQYPGCTTFGGRKVLVYTEDSMELQSVTSLDPHFLESGLSPIARFPGDAQGWQDAIDFTRLKARWRIK